MSRGLIGRYLPTQFRNPVGLALRVWRNGRRPGRSALFFAGLGLILSPLDLLLALAERRRYQRAAGAEAAPLVFVCGAPRSGTTLVAQALVRCLPVGYFNNLTSLFPRSPLTAQAWFGRWIPRRPVEFRAYYGKSAYLSGPNDALYLWDRWCGPDRTRVPGAFDAATADSMRSFFAAAQTVYGGAMVNKNNSLNTFADQVAAVLANASFICLDRDPAMLAQSLLIARREIVGDPGAAYGVNHRAAGEAVTDPIEDVCRQVVYHQEMARRQQARIGAERFRILPYEVFCADPGAEVRRVADQLFGPGAIDPAAWAELASFTVSDRVRIAPAEMDQIRACLVRLGARRPEPSAAAEPGPTTQSSVS